MHNEIEPLQPVQIQPRPKQVDPMLALWAISEMEKTRPVNITLQIRDSFNHTETHHPTRINRERRSDLSVRFFLGSVCGLMAVVVLSLVATMLGGQR